MRKVMPTRRGAGLSSLGFFAVALLLFAADAAFGQETAAPQADAAELEAALFAGSGASDGNAAEAPAGTVSAGASAQAVDGFAAQASGGEAARTEYLVGGTVVARAAAAGTAGGYYSATSDVKGKLLAKVSVPDYGSLFIAYNASYPFFQGASGGASIPAADPAAPEFTLSELHYSFDIGKQVFLRVGRQLVAWGPSRVWTPVDFINSEKVDSFADLDTRVGKNALRVHVPFSKANLFLFADFDSLTVAAGAGSFEYGDPARLVNLGGRADFVAGPFEFGLSGYGGHDAQARFGADFSGRLLGTSVYGEAAFAPEYGSYQAWTQIAAGASRVLDELKYWTLSIEGFYNSKGRDLSGYTAATIYTLSADERAALYQGSYYAYAALTATKLGSAYISGSLSAIANLQDRSFFVKLAPSFSFPRAVPFTFALGYFGGGADKEFTRFVGDGAMTATLSAKIEF